MTRAQFGYLGRYNKNWGYSPFEGFIVGGDGMSGYNFYGSEIISLRGYSNYSLTDVLYLSNFNPFQIKRSAGVGVRVFLPMVGLLGVDWGWGFDDQVNGKSQFHFVIGQQF